MTALSTEEVIYKEDKGAFYHMKYLIEGTDEYLEVATTRPETLFGDTAVAVNPSDERYKIRWYHEQFVLWMMLVFLFKKER